MSNYPTKLELKQVRELIEANALFVCNHSAGKDSQAMYNVLRELIPAKQLIVIHADLGRVEWSGNVEHIRSTISPDHHFAIVRAKKTLFDMVEHRGMFPSPSFRQCTSDLKVGPIQKYIRAYMAEHGFDTVVNCMGLRAEESSQRAKKEPFKFNQTLTNSKRTWYDWLPIHAFSWSDVLATENHTLEELKQRRELYRAGRAEEAFAGWKFHTAYAKGMSRLSCCFCIMSSRSDLKVAARENPELLAEYSALERKVDHTLIAPSKKHGKLFLDQIVAGEEAKELAEELAGERFECFDFDNLLT